MAVYTAFAVFRGGASLDQSAQLARRPVDKSLRKQAKLPRVKNVWRVEDKLGTWEDTQQRFFVKGVRSCQALSVHCNGSLLVFIPASPHTDGVAGSTSELLLCISTVQPPTGFFSSATTTDILVTNPKRSRVTPDNAPMLELTLVLSWPQSILDDIQEKVGRTKMLERNAAKQRR